MRVVLYQMHVEIGQVQNNLQKIDKVLQKWKPKSGSIVILPELFLTSYDKETIEQTAFHDGNMEYVTKLKEIIAPYDIKLFGSISEKQGNEYFNTAILLTKDRIIVKYQKSHLFGPLGEKELFQRGSTIAVTLIDNVQIGLSICYDLRFPALYQHQAVMGMEVGFVVAEWPIARVNHWMALLRARAIENQCYMIGVNRVGTDRTAHYGGHSVIYDPYGDTILKLEHDREEVVVADLDLSQIRDFRNKFDVREDRTNYVNLD